MPQEWQEIGGPAAERAEAARDSASNSAMEVAALFLGAYATDPTSGPNGADLMTGARYFNTTQNRDRVYNGSSWQFPDGTDAPVVMGGSVPTGTILPYGAVTAPDGFLLCDGSLVSQTTYADLFAVIGTNFSYATNVGFGAANLSAISRETLPDGMFRLPNGRGVWLVGSASMGRVGQAIPQQQSSTLFVEDLGIYIVAGNVGLNGVARGRVGGDGDSRLIYAASSTAAGFGIAGRSISHLSAIDYFSLPFSDSSTSEESFTSSNSLSESLDAFDSTTKAVTTWYPSLSSRTISSNIQSSAALYGPVAPRSLIVHHIIKT